MKVDMKEFDIDIEQDTKYMAKPNEFNDIYENLKVTPFVYRSQDPNIFKLVLTWEFLLLDNDNKRKQIIKALGEHHFFLTLDGNYDREILTSAIGVSHIHLQAYLFEELKRTGLIYVWKQIDKEAVADQILAHFPNRD